MKKLMIPACLMGMTALLSSCGTPDVATPINPSTTNVTGIVGSGSGAGSIALKGQSGNLATAPVDADGNFSLTLPSASALSGDLVSASAALNSIGCAGALTSTATGAKAFGFASLEATRNSGAMTVVSGSLSINTTLSAGVRMWVYVDQATTISGSVDCTKLLNNAQVKSILVNVNATLNPGWNAILFTGNSSGLIPPYEVSGKIEAIPDNTSKWLTTNDLLKTLVGL